MLEEIPSQSSVRQVFRLASIPSDRELLAKLELDAQGTAELRELLSSRPQHTDLKELCDAPFRPRPRLLERTRFSDGSFPVFYSSLNKATAKAEMRYWLPRYCGRPTRPRPAFYQQFSCTFGGIEKDLRPKIGEWPHLVHEHDYSFCNQLGAEAVKLKIDGLLTPSARHDGSNLPIFRRGAISHPALDDVVAMTYDPETGDVAVQG